MRKQADILEKIHEVGVRFLSKKTIDEAYKTIIKESLRSYEGSEGSVLIAEGEELKRIYASYPLFYDIKVKKNDIKFKAYKTLIPLIVSGKEFKIDEKEYPFLKKLKIRSIILIPLSYAYKRVGILVIWSKKRKPKMEEKPKILKLLGFFAHVSVQKLKSRGQDSENIEIILKKIYEATLRFLTPLSQEDTYEAIVKEAVKLVNADGGILRLEDKGLLKSVYSTFPETTFNPRKKGWAYTAFSKQKAFIVQARKLKKVHPQVTKTGVRSVIFIPLSYKGNSYGVLVIRSLKDKRFSSHELSVLKLFGSLASLAIRKVQLFNETKGALDTRDLFISLASHELRTPLTTINGYVQMLLAKVREKKPIDNKWILELAFEVERMKNLLDEFLEINRIRVGKMQFNFGEISLSEIVNHAISTFKFNFPERNLTVSNKLPQKDLIIGDSDKLHQVFMNVLENAVKYSNPKTEISLILYKQKDWLKVIISDKGQGIVERDMPLVFKGFYKGKNSAHEGMGLGLYLAKNIIDMHHGEISVKSKLNLGTKISIKLPKAEDN